MHRLLVLICATAAAMAADGPADAVRAYLDAWNRRDAVALGAVFLPDATIVHGGRVDPVGPWVAAQTAVDRGREWITDMDTLVDPDGSGAVVLFRFRHVAVDGVVRGGQDAVRLARRDGVWRIAGIVWMVDPLPTGR